MWLQLSCTASREAMQLSRDVSQLSRDVSHLSRDVRNSSRDVSQLSRDVCNSSRDESNLSRDVIDFLYNVVITNFETNGLPYGEASVQGLLVCVYVCMHACFVNNQFMVKIYGYHVVFQCHVHS